MTENKSISGKPQAGHPVRMAGNFYGRRKAKPVKNAQQNAMDKLLPRLLVDLDKPCPENLNELFEPSHGEKTKFALEIGFGGGEHLIHRAKTNEDTGFIGCEPFINGMAKAVRQIDRDGIQNIRLYHEDATQLLNWLPDNCLSRIDLLYPDPWPKKRHWKRRFLNTQNLERFFAKLHKEGEFRFASDIHSYVNWTLRHIHAHGGFHWQAKQADDWRIAWPDWLSTRYEQKALRENRSPAYFIFTKRDLA